MSANDNILAGLAGVAEGAAGVYVPWMQDEHRKRIAMQEAKAKSDQEKVPVEQLEAYTGQSYPQIARGTLVPKEVIPLLGKAEPLTPLVNEQTGEVVGKVPGKPFGVGKKSEQHGKVRQILLSEAIAMRKAGKEVPGDWEIIRDTEGGGSQQKDLQDRLDELDSVIADVGALRGKYNNSLHGGVGGTANALQHLPLIGGTIAPDTKDYKDTVGTTALNVQKVLTKTGRAMGSGLAAESVAFPGPNDKASVGASKFNEMERKLNERRTAIIRRMSGAPASAKTPYSGPVSGGGDSTGSSGGDMSGYSEAQKSAIAQGKW